MSDPTTTGGSAVLVPRSPEEAIGAFCAGESTTVVGGGTIVVPDTRAGRSRPQRALLLCHARLDTIDRLGGVLSIGAGFTLDRLAELPEPVPTVALGVADREIRAQATLGGNVCARSLDSVPRGDLQVPLIALGARVRTVRTDGTERTEPVEEFVAEPAEGTLVLAVEIDERPRLVGTARLSRPHTHSYTALHVSVVAQAGGGILTQVRVVAGGASDRPVRLRGVEAELDGRAIDELDPAVAARRATEGVSTRSDALASAWYRERTLPVLVGRACADLLDRREER